MGDSWLCGSEVGGQGLMEDGAPQGEHSGSNGWIG